MQVESSDYRELVAGVFAADFSDGGIDDDSLCRIHAGDHAEWLSALDRSGIFGKEALAMLTQRWRREPRVLRDVLLAEVDDVTRRRCLAAWAVLDRRRDGLTQIG